MMFESVTAASVTLSWMSGLNGGSVQTFTVYYRKDGDSSILRKQGMEERGQNERHQCKTLGLDPSTKYLFQVHSRNEYGISGSQGEIGVTTRGSVFLLKCLQQHNNDVYCLLENEHHFKIMYQLHVYNSVYRSEITHRVQTSTKGVFGKFLYPEYDQDLSKHVIPCARLYSLNNLTKKHLLNLE